MKYEAELQKALRIHTVEALNGVFEKIYNSYFKLGLFIASQYLQHEDALDVVENVFTKFYIQIIEENKCDIRDIKRYLCSTVKNESVRELYQNKNKSSFDDDKHYLKDNNMFADYELLVKELTKEEQFIITEHVLLDRTFKDIALEMNKPINTVKSLYRRGCQKARRRLTWVKE